MGDQILIGELELHPLEDPTWLIYTHACTHTDLPLQSLPTNPSEQMHTPFVQVPLTQSGMQSLTVKERGWLYDVSVL